MTPYNSTSEFVVVSEHHGFYKLLCVQFHGEKLPSQKTQILCLVWCQLISKSHQHFFFLFILHHTQRAPEPFSAVLRVCGTWASSMSQFSSAATQFSLPSVSSFIQQQKSKSTIWEGQLSPSYLPMLRDFNLSIYS